MFLPQPFNHTKYSFCAEHLSQASAAQLINPSPVIVGMRKLPTSNYGLLSISIAQDMGANYTCIRMYLLGT